jgi:hypothetical protein
MYAVGTPIQGVAARTDIEERMANGEDYDIGSFSRQDFFM